MSGNQGTDLNPLLGADTVSEYGTQRGTHEGNQDDSIGDTFEPIKKRGWSFQEGRRMMMVPTSSASSPSERNGVRLAAQRSDGGRGLDFYFYSVIYAVVNVVISAPGLYGYAAVIFNNPVFNDHMNALSKLVIFSSLVHQLGFFLFSSLDFAIGTVQDAGLIFLSGMANTIATIMLEDGHTEQEIVSTTLVLLSIGTAALGLVLMVMGRFRLADAVAYLPMPVVGGYLAYIGYFCIQAGVALCISTPIMSLADWKYILEPKKLLLATPGLVAGLMLTLISRKATSSGALPLIMVCIPGIFYLLLWITGATMEDMRDEGWVGPIAPSVPVGDLFKLVDFNQVRWDLIPEILPTWVGMVFVVSFASCLDVAAISIDMGEALDTNRELTTVGLCNFMSGLTFGFTGSYIFSQTIFTYRTGVHSRLIGVLIMCAFLYIVVSPVNVLEISPLFFLGSTLIFIGYDLMWEWLWEVRDQVFLSEYAIVWSTFCAIHVVGIDAGIVLGVLVAIVEQVVTTAQTSSVSKVERRSRAVWKPSDAKMLHDFAYSAVGGAKIVTLEMQGNIFFGSSLNMLNSIVEEIGLNHDQKVLGSPSMTPHTSSTILTLDRKPSMGLSVKNRVTIVPPRYLVLDLHHVSHLDASGTRGCFLQLVKMCSKRGITVCASGATARIEWMFRSHAVSLNNLEEEEATKARILCDEQKQELECILLFVTVQEALEFCETTMLRRLNMPHRSESLSQLSGPEERSLKDIIAHILGSEEDEKRILVRLSNELYYDELELKAGDQIFQRNTYPEAFFIVLQGGVANSTSSKRVVERQKQPVLSGAGLVSQKRVGSASNLFDAAFQDGMKDKLAATVWQAGGVFGYNDYLLDKPRTFRAVATQDGTKVARMTHSHLNLVQNEDLELHAIIQKVLLHASTLDLANCTCHDV